MDKIQHDVSLIQLSSYVKPEIKEHSYRKWVLNGEKNSFFQYIIDRYNGSPTNEAIINTFCELIYGQGIVENGSNELYNELNEIFPKREQKKCIADRKIFGQYAMQILRAKGGGVAKIMHLPMDKIGMERMNDNGEIDNIYYCEDWTNTTKYKPEPYPIFKGQLNKPIMVKVVQPYKPGKFYFSDPDYLAGLQYAEMEEEISNYCVSHIKNGLSFGYIINFNNGAALEDEQKDQIERMIRQKLTGTSNAGKFILSFNDGKEAEVTVVPLEVNEAHSQWEFLTKEARQQLIVAHGAFPNLFGIPTANGLGNNADELDVQSKLVQDYQITPIQQEFIDELANIIELNGLNTDLAFLPLRDTYKSTEQAENEPEDNTVDEEEVDGDNVELSSHEAANFLIELGEDINYDEWDLLDDRQCKDITLTEQQLNTVFQFATAPRASARGTSKQDTSLFKIRYKYAGNPNPEREFCKRVIRADKLYAWEDLKLASERVVNAGFGINGADTYDIFRFKGGVNCKHWWQRVIFLKKGNKQISVNEARRMILQLEPEERKDARWEKNPKEVAQIADESNNYWRYGLNKLLKLAGFDPNQPRAKDGKWTDGDWDISDNSKSDKFSKKQNAKTGEELNIRYVRNPNKAPKLGDKFGQDVEVAGMYVSQNEGFIPNGYESGKLTLKNPLVIEVTDQTTITYKNIISKKFGNKKGKELTSHLESLGYDGLVTKEFYKGRYYLGEIVVFNPKKSIVN